MSELKLTVTPSPHVHSGNSLTAMMRDFTIALLPATIFGIYFFGADVVRGVLIAVVSALVWEGLSQWLSGRKLELGNLHAVFSGLLLALILPPGLPWWTILVGTLLMVLLGKEVFGGYGSNPFNSVLVAWVALQLSYPDYMAQWILPLADPATTSAPMEVFTSQGPAFVREYFSYTDLFLGRTAGFTGQVSALMLLIGGAYLLWRKTINWRIPVSYLAGVFLFSGVFWLLGTGAYADPLFHILAGGTMISAFFLATDLPSTPTTPQGMILFGLGAGILTVIIRTWGAWTFGAFYAVLIFNMFTPFLDKIAPEVYGR
ncbi:MAG: RnfABCDGE type electron transport complex subunit D [Desulfohalobiaceae bacterium]|nr:RnfABCDGE type electron transport complex subunit D [Desulfohalobiaceae bacterium]